MVEAGERGLRLLIDTVCERVKGSRQGSGVDPGGAHRQSYQSDREGPSNQVGCGLRPVLSCLGADERGGLAMGDGQVVDDDRLPRHGDRF